MTTLDSEKGRFGIVQVADSLDARILMIGPQVQGAVWLEAGQPTSYPESRYCCGLLAIASQSKNRRGLIAGLGSGAGIVGLLAANLDITLDVVEIDPVVVSLALRWFPALRSAIDNRRLVIHTQPFESFEAPVERFDFCVLDAYAGSNNLALAPEASEVACSCARDLWVNFIGQPTGDQRYDRLLAEMRRHGADPTGYGQAIDPRLLELRGPRNLIITSAQLDLDQMDAFDPFPTAGPLGERSTLQYRDFCATWITRA